MNQYLCVNPLCLSALTRKNNAPAMAAGQGLLRYAIMQKKTNPILAAHLEGIDSVSRSGKIDPI